MSSLTSLLFHLYSWGAIKVLLGKSLLSKWSETGLPGFIHSLSVTAYPLQGCHGRLESIPADIEQGWGSPWTSRQFVTGLKCRDKQPFTLTWTIQSHQLTSAACLWIVGRTRSIWREPMQTWGEHANCSQKGPTPAGIEPRTLLMLDERTWIWTQDLLWCSSANHEVTMLSWQTFVFCFLYCLYIKVCVCSFAIYFYFILIYWYLIKKLYNLFWIIWL